MAAVEQFGVDAGTAVPLLALAMDGGDLESKPRVSPACDDGAVFGQA
jgi:hypothetical protein